MNDKQEQSLPILIRTTAVLLFMKVAIIEFVFFIFYSIIVLFILFTQSITGQQGTGLGLALYIFVSFIKMIAICVAILHWIHDYYELRPGIVIKKSGIFKKHSVSFRLQNIFVQTIDQSFFGRLFHYGSIELQNQFLPEHFSLSDIPHPQKCIKNLKDCMEGNLTFSENLMHRS